jgi:hypothetical protein
MVLFLFQTSTTSTPPPSNTTTPPPPPTDPPKTTEGGTNPSCPTKDPSKLCTKEGFIIDPCDLRVFYMCERFGDIFVAYRFKCGEDTVFDPSINACDWPKNVPK